MVVFKEPKVFEDVLARGLVNTEVNAKDVVTEYMRYCDADQDKNNFAGESLVYVTPVRPLAIY